jgi:GNAT superfamily N-acetyltransferase
MTEQPDPADTPAFVVPAHTWQRGRHRITTDPARVDLDVVHGFLTSSYWAFGITRERVIRSIRGSIPFSMFEDERQVGFARVISDGATFAWLADVFVLPESRGQGLGIWLVESILAHPELRGLRRWSLATRDAHTLYARHGFVHVPNPERMMEYRPDSPGAGGAPPADHPASAPWMVAEAAASRDGEAGGRT